MSLKVSSGLKATAQEWKPSFTPPAPAPAPAPAAAVAPAAAFTQFHGEYFGPTTGYYNATEAAYGYFPSPWDLATMGQQQQRRRPQQRGQRRQQGQQQQRRKGKGQQQSQQQQQQQQQTTQFAHEGGGIPGGIPIKTKKKKKKKKKSSANAEGGSAATVMKPVEIVPNRILVFKNLPFSFTVKELEDIILAECQTTPAMTSFHRDKNGQFKGFCFVYFESIAAATVVLERLHGYTLQGRSWSIEFKRVNAEDAAAAADGATLVPAPAAAPGAATSGSGSSSLVRSGSHDGGGGGLSSMALAGALIPKLSTAGGGNGRSKYRSVSESDADMNWRRTKVESDFPPKDDVGRQIYRSMVEYKEKHAAAARTAAAAAAAAATAAAAGSNTSSSPPSSDAGAASAAAAATAAAETKPAPLLISIATSQKTHQRLLQECLKRLNLDHRIKDEAGDDITYEITPRADALLMASTASHGHFHHQQQQQRLSMGAVGDGAGQLLQRRRRGGSTGAFPDSAGSGGGGKAGNARAAREARRTSGAGYEGSGEKTIKAAKYANLTVLEAAEQQARALAVAASPESASASASPPRAGAGAAAAGVPSSGASGDSMTAASFGMSAVGAAVRGLTRTKDRSESREFGSKIASGPDGSPGFQQGPRGRFGTPSRGNTPSSSGVASPTTPAAAAASGAAAAAAAGTTAAPATKAP